MKILFYVEPHPIRESHTNHFWIVSEFLDMLEDEFVNKKHHQENSQVRLVVSRGLHSMIKAQKMQGVYERFLIGLTADENNHINEMYDAIWDQNSINLWQNLMEGQGEVSEFYEKILNRIHKTVFDFDVIVYWGTNGAVRNFSKANNIPAIAMELGCARKPFFNSMYFDFLGVNGAAYTNEIDLNNVKDVYDFQVIKSFLPFTLKYGKGRDALCNPIASKYSNEIYKNIGKNILIPLQLADDANILQFSKYNSMYEFLNEIIPPLVDDGFCCFVKPHPGNVYRQYNKLDHEKCKIMCEEYSSVFWLDDIDNEHDYPSLLMKMDAIVTINSSVGFEAMLLGKVVVPLGKSPYNLSSELPTLEQLIANTIDIQLYKDRIQKIIKLLLFHYLYFKERGFSFVEFSSAIKFNMKLWKLYNTDKEKFEKYILNYESNTLEDYIDYPPKVAPVSSNTKDIPDIVATEKYVVLYKIYKKLNFYKIEQHLKATPYIGKKLLYVKKQVLRWK